MIKKSVKMLTIMCTVAFLLSSCYSYTSVVGDGAQGSEKITKWNHYVINGLVPVGVSDAKQMAGDAGDYDVHTRVTFVNGIVSALTFGIYAPSTTTVTK